MKTVISAENENALKAAEHIRRTLREKPDAVLALTAGRSTEKLYARLSEMCEKLHVTLPHFSRQFHACYGITPHNYLTKLRLEHAMSLLLNTSLSIREIAQQSGFTESNYFTKVFRKYTHMTPGDFRKEH